MKPVDTFQEERNVETEAIAIPQLPQKSRVAKPGEKRSKKGKRRINSGVPPPLAPDDYVKVVPVSKQSEVRLHPYSELKACYPCLGNTLL